MGSLSLDEGVSRDPQVLLPGPADVQPFWVLNVSCASQLLFDRGRGKVICISNLTFFLLLQDLKIRRYLFFSPYADAPTASAILFTFENKTVSYASFLMT